MADRAFFLRFGNSLPPEPRAKLLQWVLLFEEHKKLSDFLLSSLVFTEQHDISHISRMYCATDMCFSAKHVNLLLKVRKGCLNVGGSSAIWLSHFYLFILRCASRNNPICEQPDWHLAETEIESGRDQNMVLQPTMCSLLNTSGTAFRHFRGKMNSALIAHFSTNSLRCLG